MSSQETVLYGVVWGNECRPLTLTDVYELLDSYHIIISKANDGTWFYCDDEDISYTDSSLTHYPTSDSAALAAAVRLNLAITPATFNRGFLVDKGSWHYKIASLWDAAPGKDFCAYWRGIVWNAFVCLIAIAMLMAWVTSFAIGAAQFAAACMHGVHGHLFDGVGISFPVTVTLAVIIFIVWTVTMLQERRWVKRYEMERDAEARGEVVIVKKPSFIKEAWLSFKDKTCMKTFYMEDSK